MSPPSEAPSSQRAQLKARMQHGGGGGETDRRRALSATDDEFSSMLKTRSSNLPERYFWETDEVRRDSTLTASAGETKLLNVSIA